MPLPLESQRLILRRIHPDDAAVFSAYRSVPEVARYQGWQAPFSLRQAEEFIQAMSDVEPGAPGQWLQLALELKSSGEMIGDCAFVRLAEDPRQAEIGYTLAPAFQHQGYAVEAVRRLLDYLFSEFDLHRVRANCDPLNPASARVLERTGMRREGLFVESLWFKGAYADELWFAMLRREWSSHQEG